MKTMAMLLVFLFSQCLQATTCKCNCELADNRLCAGLVDLDRPCGTICAKAPSAPPIGRTACPTVKVYDESKGIYVWIVACADEVPDSLDW